MSVSSFPQNLPHTVRLTVTDSRTSTKLNPKSNPLSCTLPFLFIVSPKVVPFSFEEPIFAGESAQVTCLVSQGDEPLEISWKLSSPYNITDFTNLGIVTQSLGRRGSTLLIESAESKHRGNYTCVVTNKAATTLFTTVLNVHGKNTTQLATCLFCLICFFYRTVLVSLLLSFTFVLFLLFFQSSQLE